MKEKGKKNHWKTASIVLIVVAVVLIAYNMLNVPTYNFDSLDFKISKPDFDAVSNLLSYGQSTRICNMETGKCIVITKIG